MTAPRETLKIALWLALFSFAGCARGESDTETTSAAIVGGIPADAAHDFVIATVDSRSDSTEACSAVLIAPDVLVTARHCVAEKDPTPDLTCRVGTGTSTTHGFSKPSPSSKIAFYKDVALGKKLAVQAKTILVEGDTQGCSQDIAVVVLDGPIENTPIARIRTTGPAVGEKLTVVGTGVTSTSGGTAISVRAEREDIKVLALGPTLTPGSDAGPPRPVSEGEFLATLGFCFGDSGGPALDTSGAVVGLVSRLASPTCEVGPDVYTSLAFHDDLLKRGLALSVTAASDGGVDGDPGAATSASPATTSGCAAARSSAGSSRATTLAGACLLFLAAGRRARRSRRPTL